jgi:hypothetical protein
MRIKSVYISIFLFFGILQASFAQPSPAQPFIKLGPLELGPTDQFQYGDGLACASSTLGADIFIGAPSNGSPPGFVSGEPNSVFNITGANNDFGKVVANLGNINADNIGDFAVGNPINNSVTIYASTSVGSFNSTLLSTSPAGVFGGENFGAALTKVSLANPLVAVGIPDFGPTISVTDGRVALYDATNGAFQYICDPEGGPNSFGRFGSSVAEISDLNNDNIRDLIVGSPDLQKVEVISIGSGNICTRIHSRIIGSADNLGQNVTAIGDVNNDGIEDFLASGVGDTPNGAALVFSGVDASTLCDIRGNAAESLGASVAALGDVDFDFRPDFAVGAPTFNNDQGRVYIFRYEPGNNVCSIIYTIDGAAPYKNFGHRLAGSPSKALTCDFEQDGINEFLVSSRENTNTMNLTSNEGAVFAYSFPTPTPTPTLTPTSTPTFTNTPTATPTNTIAPSATANPKVTATPTATATGVTPTKSRFNFRITSNGNFVGTNTLEGSSSRIKIRAEARRNSTLNLKDCKVSLIGRYSNNNLSSVSSTFQVANSKQAQEVNRFTANGLSAVKKESPTDKHYILHLRAKNVCGKKVFYSNVASRYLNCGLKPSIPVEDYAASLVSKIR